MIAFTVYGTPTPQGSMRAFLPKHGTRPVIISDNKKLRPWREQIALAALSENARVLHGPISVHLAFYFRRPKSDPHRQHHTVKPDIDKLVRAVFDSLKGIVINDDAQVVKVEMTKEYTYGAERAWVHVKEVQAKAVSA